MLGVFTFPTSLQSVLDVGKNGKLADIFHSEKSNHPTSDKTKILADEYLWKGKALEFDQGKYVSKAISTRGIFGWKSFSPVLQE